MCGNAAKSSEQCDSFLWDMWGFRVQSTRQPEIDEEKVLASLYMIKPYIGTNRKTYADFSASLAVSNMPFMRLKKVHSYLPAR